MTETAFTMDWKDFDAKFVEFIKKVSQEIAAAGLKKGMDELLNDAEDEAPTVPWLHGDLRGSREIEDPIIKGEKILVRGGYNSIYAARLHEGEPEWDWTRDRTPSPGPKYLESKMARKSTKYMRIAADYMKTEIERRG